MGLKNPFRSKERRSQEKLQKRIEKEPLHDYEVGDTLGEGGFGTVRRAHQKGAEKGVDIAVKIVPRKSIAPGRNEQKELLRRFHLMQGLGEHPHIIKLLDYRMTKQTLFAFYELCRGHDLFDRILEQKGGRFTERQAREATRSLTDAIAFIHDRGVVHRDIKPENVLYRQENGPYGDLVLADFGLSVSLGPDEELEGAAGSPGYWSPEMCSGKGYGMLADEWALGIVVYAMLSGRSPFKSLDADDLRKECAKGDVGYPSKYWATVSTTGAEFVQRLLQKDPRHRMTARGALEHKWLLSADSPQADAKADLPPAQPADSAPPDKAVAALADDAAGKLERRPTHGLTPAGLSMRFDKARQPAPPSKPSAAPSNGGADLAPTASNSSDDATLVETLAAPLAGDAVRPFKNGHRRTLSSHPDEPELADEHVVSVADALRGNVSHGKLHLLATLDDDSENSTPAESRRPSTVDLTAAAERLHLAPSRGSSGGSEHEPH